MSIKYIFFLLVILSNSCLLSLINLHPIMPSFFNKFTSEIEIANYFCTGIHFISTYEELNKKMNELKRYCIDSKLDEKKALNHLIAEVDFKIAYYHEMLNKKKKHTLSIAKMTREIFFWISLCCLGVCTAKYYKKMQHLKKTLYAKGNVYYNKIYYYYDTYDKDLELNILEFNIAANTVLTLVFLSFSAILPILAKIEYAALSCNIEQLYNNHCIVKQFLEKYFDTN